MTALLFDCDGTLADSMPAHYQAWLEILRPHGIPFPETRFYSMGGMPTKTILEALFGEAGQVPDLETLAREKEAAFLHYLADIKPIPKVVAIAAAARGSSPMAVASGGYRHMVEKTLFQIGIRDWFSVVVAAEDTVRHKPHPDVFLEAARRLGVTPAECVVYEDTDIGIQAAKAAGMAFVDVRKL